jgi:transcription antitermination factor NusG
MTLSREHHCDDLQWYALQVRPRYEKAVSTSLRGKGFEEFLPVRRTRRIWSDRIAQVELPLFPGYLFCRLEPGSPRGRVLSTAGVIQIVGVGNVPISVDPNEISAIRRLVESGVPAEKWPYLKTGNRVRIEYGALSGVEGILINVKKQHRLVIGVSLLQRSVAVEVEREWVVPCAGPVRTPVQGPGRHGFWGAPNRQ